MSTRMLVSECFDGNHPACKDYNAPADNPNFNCRCECHGRVHSPTGNELTVESALAELREMTPHVCEISYRTAGTATIRITVWANSIIPTSLFNAYGESLQDAMAQVRKWKESQ